MASLIQFSCPVCATTLRLPIEMAGTSGACPCCGRDIIAPDPQTGTGPDVLPPPPVPETFEPFRPFADPPPAVALEETIDLPPEPEVFIPETPAPPRTQPVCAPLARGRRMVITLCCLLTALVSLAAGYYLGIRSNWIVAATPLLELKTPPPTKHPLTPIPPEPKQPEVTPLVPDTPDAEKEKVKTKHVNATTAAQTALRAFLDAPTWTARSAYVLAPEKVRREMEEYSHQVPDGPTPYKSITFQNSYTDKISGNTFFIYQIVTEAHPSGFPVAIAETPSGWGVDWKTFVETRDGHFRKFAENAPVDQLQSFHLVVTAPPPDRAAKTESADFASFLIDPPHLGCQRLAYVRKNSEAYSIIKQMTADGAYFPSILEISKRNTPDGKGYIKIEKVLATDWLPAESQSGTAHD